MANPERIVTAFVGSGADRPGLDRKAGERLAFRLKALAGLDRFDVSYGLYLYAFPVQQVIVQAAGGSMPPLQLFAASLALTLVLATLSWFLVERPMLRLKPGRPDPRLTDPAANAASPAGAFAIGRGGG